MTVPLSGFFLEFLFLMSFRCETWVNALNYIFCFTFFKEKKILYSVLVVEWMLVTLFACTGFLLTYSVLLLTPFLVMNYSYWKFLSFRCASGSSDSCKMRSKGSVPVAQSPGLDSKPSLFLFPCVIFIRDNCDSGLRSQ